MTDESIPCLMCGLLLSNVFEGVTNQPYDATSFTAHGNYGSLQFDEMDGSHLEINICTDCLADAAKKGRVMVGRWDPQPPVLVRWERWTAE